VTSFATTDVGVVMWAAAKELQKKGAVLCTGEKKHVFGSSEATKTADETRFSITSRIFTAMILQLKGRG